MRISLPLLAVLLTAGAHRAPAEPVAQRPVLEVPYASIPPEITADLADPAWAGPPQLPGLGFSLGFRATSVPPATHVSARWDANTLYLRFVCDDDDIYVPHHGHNSNLYEGDVVEAFVDPVGDSREFVELELSPDNDTLTLVHLITAPVVASDAEGTLLGQIQSRDDWSFPDETMHDLKTATQRVPRAVLGPGWVADFAIPAKPLLRRTGLKTFSPMTLRANFIRYDVNLQPGKKDNLWIPLNWSPVAKGRPHRAPEAMGTLILLPAPKAH